MNPSKYAFQAGLFILLSIAAGLYLIAQVAESRSTPKDATPYVAEFPAGEDIAGLSIGAEVRLLGVKVGRVDKITVNTPTQSDQDASIHVAFSVGKGVELREDSPRVELQTAVTGGAWLNILSVGRGAALAQGATVAGRTSNLLGMVQDVRDELEATLVSMRQELDTISKELVQTADSIESSANEATALIEKIDTQIDPIVKDIDTFLSEATGVMTDVRAVFGDSGEDIRTTLANVNSITSELDTALPQTLSDINTFVASAEKFVTQAEDAIQGVEKLVTKNRPEIDRTVASARRSVDELEGLIDDLRANPSRLIWPPDEKDLNNLDLYAASRAYAKAAEDLNGSIAALAQASANDKADPAELDALRQDLLKQFDYFDKLQAEVWERFEK